MLILVWLNLDFPTSFPITCKGGSSPIEIRSLASFGKIWPHLIWYLAPSMPRSLATLRNELIQYLINTSIATTVIYYVFLLIQYRLNPPNIRLNILIV